MRGVAGADGDAHGYGGAPGAGDTALMALAIAGEVRVYFTLLEHLQSEAHSLPSGLAWTPRSDWWAGWTMSLPSYG